MHRRRFLAFAASLPAAWLSVASPLPAVEPPPLGDGGLKDSFTYKQQLEKGLKARRPSDFTFIATVVNKIETGELTQKMVNETFGYARDKSRDYPFIYFQFALRKRAAKIGVTL